MHAAYRPTLQIPYAKTSLQTASRLTDVPAVCYENAVFVCAFLFIFEVMFMLIAHVMFNRPFFDHNSIFQKSLPLVVMIFTSPHIM